MNFIGVSKRTHYIPLYLALVTLLVGCATYEPREGPSPITEDDILRNQVVLSIDSVEFHLAVMRDQQVAEKYLGINPFESNMLPVFMRIHNNGNHIVKINVSKTFFLTTSGQTYPSLTLGESIERARRDDAEVLGWAAVFGLVGALASGDQVASANLSLEEDYRNKHFKPTLINSQGSAQGILFFDIPGKEQANISAAVIHVVNLNTNDAQRISINVPQKNGE